MSALEDRRYTISEVGEITGVPAHVLRQWESRIPQLNPKRDGSNRRYYTLDDIDVVRRIKQLVRHEKLTIKGVVKRLSQEIYGEGRPKTNREVLDLLDKLETEVREALDMLEENGRAEKASQKRRKA